MRIGFYFGEAPHGLGSPSDVGDIILHRVGPEVTGEGAQGGAGVALCGSMAVTVSIASPRMAWRLLARSRMCASVSCEDSLFSSREMSPVGHSIESKRERKRAIAFASMVAE